MKVDLSYLTDTEVIMVDSTMMELREDIPTVVNPDGTLTEGNAIDNRDTTNLVKWTAEFKKDKDGNIVDVDYNYGFRLFKEKFDKARKNGKYVNISRLQGSGLCLVLAQGETRTEAFNNYLNEIKESAKSEIDDVAIEAKKRLAFLNDNMYIINVAKRRYDGDRLMDAYRDATKAVTSIAKFGYYMGGSVGLNVIVEEVLEDVNLDLGLAKKELSIKENNGESTGTLKSSIDILSTALFITKLLKEGTLYLINGLLSDLFGKRKYTGENLEYDYKEARRTGDIDIFKETYGDTRVIMPVETDLVMTRTVLYQFSNLFSSSLIEYEDPMDTLYYTKVTNDIKENIRKVLEPIVNPSVKEELFVTSSAERVSPVYVDRKLTELNNTKETITKQPEVKPEPVQTVEQPAQRKETDDRELKRKEEINRILKEREEKLKIEEQRRILEALTPGPKNFVYVPDENGNIPSFVGQKYTGPSDPVQKLHLEEAETLIAEVEED